MILVFLFPLCAFNSLYRENRENCSLLKEEVEGLRKKLERMEKIKEELVNMEMEKEVKTVRLYLPL